MAHSVSPSSIPRARCVLGIFAKWPSPGKVKTRLSGDDPEWGAEVARAFLLDMLQRFAHLADRRVLVFTPLEAKPSFASLVGTQYALRPQSEGDLGTRLATFLTQESEAGGETMVVLGTDSPTIPVEYVERAFELLETADVVLGPATDGGYYLLGCRTPIPQSPLSPFAGVAWSTASVLMDTINCLKDSPWRLALLPPWYDVDTPQDWALLRGHLAAMRRAGMDPGVPRTEELAGISP